MIIRMGPKVSGNTEYDGSYTTVVFYIRGLLLCRWHTVPTCSRIPSSKFEISNILDHAHSLLKHLCILLALNMLNA